MLCIYLLLASRSIYGQVNLNVLVDSLAKVYLKDKAGALVIGIKDNDKEKLFFYGEITKDNNQKPDSNSIFEIGSISETFTCIVYADLNLKGIIKGDDKLQKYLPVEISVPVYQEIVCKPVPPPEAPYDEHGYSHLSFTPLVCFPDPKSKPQEIMLCDLAIHTTGLPEFPHNFYTSKSGYPSAFSKDELYSFIKKFRFTEPIGYDYHYSPLGIGILAHALTVKTRNSFDELMRESFGDSLQMNHTWLQAANDTSMHTITGYNKNNLPVAETDYTILSPAYGFKSSPGDMLKFLSANITQKKNYITGILDYTHNGRIKLSSKTKKESEIALGWKIDDLNYKNRMVWQDGATNGFASYIGFVETIHFGVIILSSNNSSVTKLGEEILNAMSWQKFE